VQGLVSSEFKSCCTRTYEDKALQFLIGPSLHPGGLGLTKRLVDAMGISQADTVLDVACGLGESVKFLAREYGCKSVGVDLSKLLVHPPDSERTDLDAALLAGDGENLPFRDNAFSAAISECSMCLMTDLGVGLREILRILKPHGRIGISDIATRGPLPSELEDVLMQLLCISRRISTVGTPDALEAEGFEGVQVIDESKSLLELLETIRKRLLLAELLTATGKTSIRSDQLSKAKRLTALAKVAVENGNLGYVMLVARKP